MALYGQGEIDVEGSTAAQHAGGMRVGLGDIVGQVSSAFPRDELLHFLGTAWVTERAPVTFGL